MSDISLKGVIDMHVHSNPDIRHRAYDDFELMEAGIRSGARAIVIKTHQGTTVDRAYLCNRHNELVHHGDNNFTMFGSITLNRQMGGINPNAVESGLKLGGKVVWLPTQSARNGKIQLGQPVDQSLLHKAVQERHFFRRFGQNVADDIFQHILSQLHVVKQVREGNFRLYHPELRGVTGRIAFFRPEGGAKGVHIAEGHTEGFHVQLTADGQVRLLAKEILTVIHRSVRQLRRRLEEQNLLSDRQEPGRITFLSSSEEPSVLQRMQTMLELCANESKSAPEGEKEVRS